MLSENSHRYGLGAVALGLALMVTGPLASAARADDGRQQEKAAAKKGEDADAASGRRWLGVMFTPVGEALRAHVDLPSGDGLMVAHVVPDSPAANAGLKPHDIVFKVGDTAVKSVEDIKGVLDTMDEGQKVALQIIRGGKTKTVSVKVGTAPQAWPEGREVLPGWPPHAGDVEQLRKWVEGLGRGRGGEGAPRMRFFGPEIQLHAFGGGKQLPENLTVAIIRKGSDPAQVTVQRGDQTWKITEKELDKLPDDVRPHVRRLLGQGWPVGGLEGLKLPAIGEPDQAAPEFDERLEDVEGRLQQLFDELRELRRERKRPRRGDRESKDAATGA
jgi:membrane-associated protease RseP (regulator of RpoE activity)